MKQTEVMTLPDGLHRVDSGLFLLVRENGKYRNWIVRIQVDKKRIKKHLGSARRITLQQAKEKAAILIGKIMAGQDIDDQNPERVRHLFKDIYDEAIQARKEVAQWKSEKAEAQWYSQIERLALPMLGSKDVADITREDVLSVIRPIWKTQTVTAGKVRQRLEVIFDFAIRKGWRAAENPARWRANLEFDLPAPTKFHKVIHREAPALVELQRAVPSLWETKGGRAIVFGILTACRVTEFLFARWDEIDLQKKVFTVPPERRKDKLLHPHRVPLPRQLVAMLKTMPRDSEFVFPGKVAKVLSVNTPRILLSRKLKRVVTMHGCRSTFAVWCAENGKDETLREKSLMHAVETEVARAYQRSDLLERRRVLMQEWADEVCKLLDV